jgi:hypothetical protein
MQKGPSRVSHLLIIGIDVIAGLIVRLILVLGRAHLVVILGSKPELWRVKSLVDGQ